METKNFQKLCIVLAAISLVAGVVVYQSSRDTDESADRGEGRPGDSRSMSVAGMASKGRSDWEQMIAGAPVASFRDLMQEAMRISDASLRDEVVRLILDRWLHDDTAGLVKYWASLEVEGNEKMLAVIAAGLESVLTNIDPTMAASDEVLLVLQRLISYLAGTDPEKALSWAQKWLLNDTLESSLVAIARGMAREDVARALAIIDEMKSPLRRGQAMSAVAGIWAAKDLDAALKWAGGLTNAVERALALNMALLVGAQQDPARTAAELKANAEDINRQYLRDRDAELKANGMTEADFANDPETYKEMLASGAISPPYSGDVELMGEASKVLGSELAKTNPQAAIEWANSLEGDYLKLKALSGVLEGWVKGDLVSGAANAVDYLTTHYPNNVDLVNSVYQSWASTDYHAAADGTRMLQDPYMRSAALEAVLGPWAVKGNAMEVVDYLNNLPAAESTDNVKLAVANAISANYPEQAWEIASRISAESAQYRGLKTAFSNLVIRNPDQASAILGAATLPETTAVRLYELLEAVVGE